MKIALLRVVNSELPNAIRKLGAQSGLEAKQRYALAQALRDVKQESEKVEEARLGLVKALGEQKENGETVVKPENLPEFNRKMKELLDQEVEIYQPPTIKLSEECEITAGELETVLELVEVDDAGRNETKDLDGSVEPCACGQ